MTITPARVSTLSTEQIASTVTVVLNNQVLTLNPTNDVVKAAFMFLDPDGNAASPGASDWRAATWFSTTPSGPASAPYYILQCLVGPNGTGVLAVGTYYMWTQIQDNPETIIKQLPGTLVVY